MEELNIFKITIDPEYAEDGVDLGIEQIAFTSSPAIKVKGMAFKSETKLSFKDEPKMRIAAPAMIPGNIYRRDEMGEYYVQFTKEEIESIHQKFMLNLNNKNKFNLEHNNELTVPAYVLECWLVGKDSKADRSYSEFGIEVPEGTLFIVSQVTDQKYYKHLVDNDQIGFSIEGFLGLKFNEFGGDPSKIEIKNQNTMEEKLLLPDGEHLIGEKIYVVKGGEVTEIKDKVELQEVVEPVIEEEKIEDEVITEPVAMALVPEEVMSIIQPKLDEIYGVIADLKSLIEGQIEEEKQDDVAPVQMSAHQAFAEVIKFANQ